MTDRELLELAAKAAGLEVWRHPDGSLCIVPQMRTWNPLEDDGDALRLAVRLGLGISIPLASKITDVVTFNGPAIGVREVHGNPYAATRRAIVRAAAEIGR